jgi:ornithine carbamoyltransferase
MDSPQSFLFYQAENRMHVQKAILLLLLGGEMGHLKIRSANA